MITAFQEMHAGKAMFWGGFVSLIFTVLYFLQRKTFAIQELSIIIFKSMKSMLPILFTLVLSWSIGTVIVDRLETGKYIAQFLTYKELEYFLPLFIFILSCITAFSTGSSWGTFAIMIPIVIPMAQATNEAFLVQMLSATLAGAIYGDHCSPISDTTILSSIGAGCSHMDHVVTQAPYSTLVAIVCCVSFLVSSFTISQGMWYSASYGMLSGIILLIFLLWWKRKSTVGSFVEKKND